jgi:hypothetical protein
MFGSGLGWFTPPKLTQAVGADIVMESIALLDGERLRRLELLEAQNRSR